MKKHISALFISILFTVFLCISASAAVEIPVYVNGTPIQSDVPAQIISDRTMVPMRAIFDALGAVTEWNDAEKKATATLGDITVSIKIGEKKIYANGKAKEIDVPAQIVGSRTLLPLRAVSESLDCEVIWNANERYVRIITFRKFEPKKEESDLRVKMKIGDISIPESVYNFIFYSIYNSYEDKTMEEYDELTQVSAKKYAAILKYNEGKGLALHDYEEDELNCYFVYLAERGAIDLLAEDGITPYAVREVLYLTEMSELFNEDILKMDPVTDDIRVKFVRDNMAYLRTVSVETQKIADEVLALYRSGTDFEQLIRDYSLNKYDDSYIGEMVFINRASVFSDDPAMMDYFDRYSQIIDTAAELSVGEVSEKFLASANGFEVVRRYDSSEIPEEYILKRMDVDRIIEKWIIDQALTRMYEGYDIEIYE